jgi:uncharacterized phage-associated protein
MIRIHRLSGRALFADIKLHPCIYGRDHLASFDGPLFGDQLQAWSHGPVGPTVYREYRSNGANAITLPEEDPFEWDEIDSDTTDFLIDVWEIYGSLAPWRLRDMTHAEPPWKANWRPDEMYSEISWESLTRYFKTRSLTH